MFNKYSPNTYSVPHGRYREVPDEVFELEEFLDKSCHFFHHLFIHSFKSPPTPFFQCLLFQVLYEALGGSEMNDATQLQNKLVSKQVGKP